MHTDIAADALRFLSRRDLDKACAVSRWLDAVIAQCCEVYPLRPVYRVDVLPCWTDHTRRRRHSAPTVLIEVDEDAETDHFFLKDMDEAVHFANSVIRHSYVETLEFGDYSSRTTFSPDHWTTLTEAVRTGGVRCLSFIGVDLTALDDDVFMVANGFRGLQFLVARGCVFPTGFIGDDFIRSSVAKGLLEICFDENKSDAPHTLQVSEDAVLDAFFPACATPGPQWLQLTLEGSHITDMFLTKFFERLRSSPFRRFGSVEFYGAAKQSGLPAYDGFLVPSELYGRANYRFPSTDGENKYYDVVVRERPSYIDLQICPVRRFFDNNDTIN